MVLKVDKLSFLILLFPWANLASVEEFHTEYEKELIQHRVNNTGTKNWVAPPLPPLDFEPVTFQSRRSN